ncbi:putative Haloacid dehalogenase-like hydrolase; putative Phosphatase [Bradyrhizobium sp. ORS 285]|uniref:HAD family hydrolase n=1 Tax=Bradyrhizobium sp. ORS 285 TaxID=115808 RepID=UPI0002406295|nr:HAD family hydrolase [Bradyrhizobium sp. ORS 285]CCD90103.1 putative Haloacid dehalogenase-like hydrolase; Phosphatase [Bradyrhizobium sp. ORS 285]SMX62206.1 putative Haloacid dehalogenase-like hydrolase; putative Phosphatase [Bradyrhizobium sp. ORS 285]
MADAAQASPLDLVIFDCDGVLVDSEVISCQAHADVLSLCGYPITATEVFDRFLGRSSKQATMEVEAELGRSLPDDFNARLQERLFRTFEQELRPVAGISDALDALDLPVCVASSGSHQRMRVSLGATRLYDRLAPHIFSSSQVENGKPAPDLFLFAAAQMNARPAACVVVEDSIAGIRGGLAAGMTVLGFHGGSHCRPRYADSLRQAGATLVFDDMRQLPAILGQLGEKTAPLAGFSAV